MPGASSFCLNRPVIGSSRLQQALYKDRIQCAQLYTEDIAAEFERLRAKGVAFRDEPKSMGPTKFADFDDTCGNLIRLVEG